ncbi:hypothetical protein BDR06DRAFT_975873 [Suillus hirtellus]|nr:hypothetical protein BDR06DRAFT_975873 [Suillus hirtellus]
MAEIQLRLTEAENAKTGRLGTVSWIIQGINLEDAQFCWAEDEEHDWEAHVADLEDDSKLVDDEISAEDMGLWMPSSVPHNQVTLAHLLALQAEKLELRRGQASDCLEKFGWLLVIRLSSTVNTLEALILCGLGQDPSKKLNIIRVHNGKQDQTDTWMDEFYRVNWLKAKARWNRWEERLSLVQHEMGWTVLVWKAFTAEAEEKFKDKLLVMI